jgi:HK97 family phage major capsid protein
MSSEINEDAVINLADDLAAEIAYAFSNAEDTNGFNGDGTSTYGGIWGATVKINDGNHAASIHTAATNNDSFGEFTLTDFHGVVGKLPLYARMNAKWYISAAGFANSMERLAYAGGGNTTSHITGGTGLAFLGYPVVLSQVLNTSLVGTPASGTIACLFGDLRLSTAFGSRRGVTVAMSEHRYFDTDQIGIRGTQRVDINNHSLGPLIALKTP